MSSVEVKTSKANIKGCMEFYAISQVARVFATLTSLTKVTFETTVIRPTKKLASLANINNHRDPLRISKPSTNLGHTTLEIQADTRNTTQLPLPTMATVPDQSPPSPRRSTISAFPAPAPRTRKNGGNGQCTHLTTTRLYTNEFRCALCLHEGSFGWLYRCTQDRELLLDEDMENGFEVSTIPTTKYAPGLEFSLRCCRIRRQ